MVRVPILIVEDNPLNLKLLSYLLHYTGYDVQTALNAQEALEKLEKTIPELIIIDIQLPGMDGLELTEKLKSDLRYKHISIIAVTAYAMKGDKERALERGCDGYITKPIDIKTFPQEISQYLNKKSDKDKAE